jgi:hypothetical protein
VVKRGALESQALDPNLGSTFISPVTLGKLADLSKPSNLHNIHNFLIWRTGCVAQMVEYLPSRLKTLISNSNTAKKSHIIWSWGQLSISVTNP